MLPIRFPNLNARVERFVQTIKYEALNQFIAFGKRPLDEIHCEEHLGGLIKSYERIAA